MTPTVQSSRSWGRIPVMLRAVVTGLAIGLVAANVWPLLLLNLGMPTAALVEFAFLAAYIWWGSGGGPPRSWMQVRAESFRAAPLTGNQWFWSYEYPREKIQFDTLVLSDADAAKKHEPRLLGTDNQIVVPEPIAGQAKLALQRMLDIA